MSENTAVVVAATDKVVAPYGLRKDGTPKAAPGRKIGSTVTLNPNRAKGVPSAVRAYILRTQAALSTLPPDTLETVVSNMAPTVAKSPEFLASEEFVMAPLFARIADVAAWEANYRAVTIAALIATADPLECDKLLKGATARREEIAAAIAAHKA